MELEIRPLDLLVIGGYLLGMLGIGAWFSRKNHSTEEYFVGNRAFPGWAIGLSMLGTSISSVTFLAFPAAAYILDWRQLVSNFTLPLVAIVAIFLFIPFFHRAGSTTAFEYLQDRFGTPVRLYAACSFMLLQLLRLANVLFLVAIPVSLLTGFPMQWVIVAVGLFITFYTVAGGFEAVIWTDVVQTIVLWVGGLFCFGYIACNLPDGLSQIYEVGHQHQKFHLGSWEWNGNERTFWTVAIIGIFNWLAMYSSDQNVIQRYVATKSLAEARRATAIYTLLAVPTWTFFFLVGTSLFVWYQAFPDPHVTSLAADQVFPYFILTQVPAGLAGLTIAGVLAAAMSSLDSSINAIATVCTIDVIRPYLLKNRSDRFYLNLARGIATFTAAIMILGAVLLCQIESESMNDLNWIVSSVFGGCLVGIFMIGFFTQRVDTFAATASIGLAILVNIYLGLSAAGWLPISWTTTLHTYWTGLVVNLVFVVSCLLISCFRPVQKNLTGLTVWDRN